MPSPAVCLCQEAAPSGAGRPQLRMARGFSLIEMVIALSLVVLVISIGAISFKGSETERIMSEASINIEAMASRGHAMSVLHQKPFWLRFEDGRVFLVGADIKPAPIVEPEFEESWEEEVVNEVREVVYEEFSTPAEISLRRWGAPADEWITPKKDEFLFWQFQSTGLCEPVSIRIILDESWIILHMHPLTGRVEEEESSIE